VLQFMCVRFRIWELFCVIGNLCMCAFVALDLVSSEIG